MTTKHLPRLIIQVHLHIDVVMTYLSNLVMVLIMNFGATVIMLVVNNLKVNVNVQNISPYTCCFIDTCFTKKNTLDTSGNIPFDEKNLRSYRKIQRYPIDNVYPLTKLWIITSSVYNIIQHVRGEE